MQQMSLEVSNESLDYIFRLADTSGDGQISFDEFNALFENIIKEQGNDD